jgi:hypothetical protein
LCVHNTETQTQIEMENAKKGYKELTSYIVQLNQNFEEFRNQQENKIKKQDQNISQLLDATLAINHQLSNLILSKTFTPTTLTTTTTTTTSERSSISETHFQQHQDSHSKST